MHVYITPTWGLCVACDHIQANRAYLTCQDCWKQYTYVAQGTSRSSSQTTTRTRCSACRARLQAAKDRDRRRTKKAAEPKAPKPKAPKAPKPKAPLPLAHLLLSDEDELPGSNDS